MRLRWLAFLLFTTSTVVYGQIGPAQYNCFLGGTSVKTQGIGSTNYMNGVVPSCTVTVYQHGTQTKATIFADSNSTPLSNPFTGNALGSINPGGWIFWAQNGQYDVVLSGGIPPNSYFQPVPLTIQIGGSGGGTGVTNVSCGNLNPLFNCGVSTPSTTPAIAFTQQNAAANTIFGNFNGTSGPPFFATFTCTGLLTCTYNSGTNIWNVNIPSTSTLSITATTPIEVNGGAGPVSSGTANISCPTCGSAQLATFVKFPTSGNFVVLYPTSASISSDPSGLSVISATGTSGSGDFVWACTGLLCGIAPTLNASWTGFSLPPGISPGSVTGVWLDTVNSVATTNGTPGSLPSGGANTSQIACADSGGHTANGFNPSPPPSIYGMQEITAAISGTTGALIPSFTCSIRLGATSSSPSGIIVNVATVRLLVAYTGAPPPPSTLTYVAPPLYYNTALNYLGIDLTDIPAGHLIQPSTISNLPPAVTNPGNLYFVPGTNGVSCSTAGSTAMLCFSNGTSYVPYVGVGAVSSVSNSDSSLTISPTTGNVVASINTAHSNTWSAPQTFSALTTATSGQNFSGTTSPVELAGSAGTAGQCLTSAGPGATDIWGACGGGGTLPTATYAGQMIIAQSDSNNVYVIGPNVYYAQTTDTLTSLGNKCGAAGGPFTLFVNIQVSATITSNTSLNSNCWVVFGPNGSFNITSTGGTWTFTIPNIVQGPPTQHVVLGTTNYAFGNGTKAYVEWCGAKGDYVWGVGPTTDDHAAINACISAVTQGEVHLLAKNYYVGSSTIVATGKSSFSLIGSNQGYGVVSYSGSNRLSTQLISGSASADILQFGGSGSGPSNWGYWDQLMFISTARGVPATVTTSNGILVQHTCGANVWWNQSQDSGYDFHIIDDPACGVGSFQNNQAGYCYNGAFLGVSGTWTGWYLDATSLPFNSLRMMWNSSAIDTSNCASTGFGTQGILLQGASGVAIADIMVDHFEDGEDKHTLVINNVATTGYTAGDLTFDHLTADGNTDIPIEVSSLSAGANGSLIISDSRINGNLGSGTGLYGLQCTSSTGLKIIGNEFIDTGTTAALYLNSCSASTVVGNTIHGWSGTGAGSADVVKLNSSTGISFAGNAIYGQGNVNGMHFVSSSGNAVEGVIGGTLTNGVLADASSNNNKSFTLLAQDTGSTIGTFLNDSGTGNQISGGGGAVSSVSNSDGTLTISPTTGAVVASIALGHANTWTALQTLSAGENLSGTTAPLQVAGSAGTIGQCLQSQGTGATPAWGSCGGGGGGFAGTETFTASHTLATSDNGFIIIFNCSSACALTLPNPQPTAPMLFDVQSIGSSTATITLGSSMTFNGGASVPVLLKYDLIPIATDSGTSTNYVGKPPDVAGTNITLTPAANGITIAASGGGGTSAYTLLYETTFSSTTSATAFTRNVTGQSGNLFQTDFDTYEVRWAGVTRSTSLTPIIQVSTDAATCDSTAGRYGWQVSNGFTSGASHGGSTSSQTGIALFDSNDAGVANSVWSAVAQFNQPLSTANYKDVHLHSDEWHSTAGPLVRDDDGFYTVTGSAVLGFCFNASTGNFAAGVMRVYGVAK